MNFLKAIGIGFIVTLILAIILGEVLRVPSRTVDAISIGLALVVTMAAYVYLSGGPTKLIANAASGIAETKDEIAARLEEVDADYYATSEREVNENRTDPELWSQALVKAKGNEALRKVEYMKLRVKQLKRASSG